MSFRVGGSETSSNEFQSGGSETSSNDFPFVQSLNVLHCYL